MLYPKKKDIALYNGLPTSERKTDEVKSKLNLTSCIISSISSRTNFSTDPCYIFGER